MVGFLTLALTIGAAGAAAADPQSPGAPAAATSQPAPPPPPPLVIELSTTPFTRNAVIGDAGFGAFARVVDWGLDRATGVRFTSSSFGGRAARIGRFALLDIPMAQYLFAWTHEYGHKTRVNEAGFDARVIVDGTPWSLDARTEFSLPDGALEPGMFAGGFEGTSLLARRVERRLFTADRAHYADLMSLFMTQVLTFGYIQRDLAPGRVADGFTLLGPQFNDPSGYVVTVLERRLGRPATLAERQTLAREVRRASWLNLIDVNLATVGAGLFGDYLWNGRRDTHVRWLRAGGVAFIPSLRYELTPIGPERQVRTALRVGRSTTMAYVRWSDRLDADRLVGAGVDYFFAPSATWRPSVSFDIWTNPDGRRGVRVEGSTEWSRASADRWHLLGAAGVKRRGYLPGFPDKAGAYLNVGVGIRF